MRFTILLLGRCATSLDLDDSLLFYFRAITILADVGFYLGAAGRLVGEPVENSPLHRTCMQTGVFLHGLNQTV